MTLSIQAKVKINTRKLKAIPQKVDQAIIRGLQRGAYEVERRAKRYAPIDTGRLMRSIKTNSVRRGANELSISVAPTVEYAEHMERPGRVRRRGRRPYMEPALKDSVNKIISILTNELRRAIK